MAFSPYTHCLDKLASAQHAIGLESKKSTSTLNAFMAWVDIQEYRAIPTEDYRRSKALHIYLKYVKHNAVLKLHGISESGRVIFNKAIKRAKLLAFFETLPPCTVGMEACGSSHHWGRQLRKFGHDVRLMPANYVKPYVKRGKTDAVAA